MKNTIKKIIYVFCFLFSLTIIYFYLVPEKSNTTVESKLRDSANVDNYKQDALNEHSKKINLKISEELNNISVSMQANAILLTEAIKIHGSNSDEVQQLYEMKLAQEEVNKKIVTQIIDKYGWLGANKIGAQNNYTLFAVIQNSDYETQEKYLSIMEDAVKSGTLAPEHYAAMVDRKALVQHHKQIFGSQINKDVNTGKNTFATIIDEEQVNQRRSAIGLVSLEFYATQNNVDHVSVKDNI
jgi:hypothetical protein